MFDRLINKMKDPSIKWYVQKSFGGNIVYDASTYQILHICDDMICLPVRFSSNISWLDSSTDTLTRMFNYDEAWDHTNATNPTTTDPLNGLLSGIIGYRSYFIAVDLVRGSYKSKVHIIARYEPEPQVLIFNTGKPIGFTINVYNPPSALGLDTISTNGIPYSDKVELQPGQYVVYTKENVPEIDKTKGVFSTSPMGLNKRFSNELYYTKAFDYDLEFNLYSGIKTPTDIRGDLSSIPNMFGGGSSVVGNINVSGYSKFSGILEVMLQDTQVDEWNGGYIGVFTYSGWGEDENTNVEFVQFSSLIIKQYSDNTQVGYVYSTSFYDCSLDEWFNSKIFSLDRTLYSYGRNSGYINPYIVDGAIGISRGSRFYAIDKNDNVIDFSGPPSSTNMFFDGYWAFCNDILLDSNEYKLATSVIALYTSDTNLTTPSNIKDSFSVVCKPGTTSAYGIQIVPYGDRSLTSPLWYGIVTRTKILPSSATADDFKAWATKIQPYLVKDTNFYFIIDTLPFAVGKFGKPVSDITATIPDNIQPGQTITITGSAPNARNTNIHIAVLDPDNYSTITHTVVSSDNNGDFSANITIPSTAQPKKYRVYILAVPSIPVTI